MVYVYVLCVWCMVYVARVNGSEARNRHSAVGAAAALFPFVPFPCLVYHLSLFLLLSLLTHYTHHPQLVNAVNAECHLFHLPLLNCTRSLRLAFGAAGMSTGASTMVSSETTSTSLESATTKYGDLNGNILIVELHKGQTGLGLSLAGNRDRKKMSVFVCGLHPRGSAFIDGRIKGKQ